jgi:hypothetical protein
MSSRSSRSLLEKKNVSSLIKKEKKKNLGLETTDASRAPAAVFVVDVDAHGRVRSQAHCSGGGDVSNVWA